MKHLIYQTAFILFLAVKVSAPAFSQDSKNVRTFSSQTIIEKNSTIRVNNTYRNIEIRLWDQQTCKIELSIPDSIAKGIDEKNWMEKTGIRTSKFMNWFDIVINGISLGADVSGNKDNSRVNNQFEGGSVVMPFSVQYDMAVNYQLGRLTGMQKETAALKNIIPVTVYLPASASVEVVNKYSSLRVFGNINKGYFNLENTVLDAINASELRIIAKHSTLNVESIGNCDADISYSTFRGSSVDKMDIESTQSTVEFHNVNRLYIRSSIDNGYFIEELEQAEGRLLYGNIRIEKLNKRLDLDGNNYDLKIRQINPDVELIKINNSWADIRIPVRSLTNYVVSFDGKNCAVFAPFEIIPEVKEEPNKNDNTPLNFDRGNILLKNSQRPNAPRYFSAKAGNISGKHTEIQITCQQCTVDFK